MKVREHEAWLSVSNIFLSVSKLFKCLKLNRQRLKSLSIVLEHGLIQRGLLTFRLQQLANQIAGFQLIVF